MNVPAAVLVQFLITSGGSPRHGFQWDTASPTEFSAHSAWHKLPVDRHSGLCLDLSQPPAGCAKSERSNLGRLITTCGFIAMIFDIDEDFHWYRHSVYWLVHRTFHDRF